jgi:CheY-like chemotaxis protein
MNAIMGFSTLLVDNYNNKPKLEQFSKIINLRCNDLLKIINDILDISAIESGQLPVNSEQCNLDELFTEITAFFKEHQKRIGKQQIGFELQALCDPSENVIVTDKVKLRQIFINLIGNAFKFTNTGKIEGGCKFDAHQNLVFYVSDTGIGIPPDKQDVIFERFSQLHHDKNFSYGGTGLGLSIVKGLVDLLGGKIWLESELEKGTSFYFSFPFQIAQSAYQAEVSIDENLEYHFPDKTILVVEDDIFNAVYIKEILSDTGLKIINTEYGYEAVRIATSQSPDLVLMDIRLPDMSGYEAIRQIRKQKPYLKIIAQTAYAAHDDKQKAFDAGCNDYISKPLKRELLLSMINKHLSK